MESFCLPTNDDGMEYVRMVKMRERIGNKKIVIAQPEYEKGHLLTLFLLIHM